MSYLLRHGDTCAKMAPIIAQEAGLEVVKVGVDNIPRNAEYCFRWGTTSGINNDEQKVVNKIRAITETASKKDFRLKLSKLGLAPRSWGSVEEYRKDVGDAFPFPVLIRPEEHERSKDMFVCKNAWDIIDATAKLGRHLYLAEFIAKAHEFRAFVVSGRIAWMIEKHPKDAKDASWGCVADGDFEYVGWDDYDPKVARCAIESFNASALDFGAVDIIVDQNGNAFCTEINTAPFLTPYYAKLTGKAFKWIVDKGRDRIAANYDKFNWRGVLHPAMDARVKV